MTSKHKLTNHFRLEERVRGAEDADSDEVAAGSSALALDDFALRVRVLGPEPEDAEAAESDGAAALEEEEAAAAALEAASWRSRADTV